MLETHKRIALFISGLGAWGLILFAWLYLEKTLYLAPCPLCMMQRLAFAIAGSFMILEAVFWPVNSISRTTLMIGKYAGIFFGLGLSARHLHIQSLPAGEIPACGFDFWGTLDKNGFWNGLLQSMQGTGDCAVVGNFLGLSIPLWSLLAFAALLMIAMIFGNPRERFPHRQQH